MKLSADCMCCLISRQQENISAMGDETVKSDYMRAVLNLVANSTPEASAPVVVAEINRLHRATFGSSYSFETLKKEYNGLLLQRENEIKARIDEAEDPLLAAVKFARAGNYIDFGAMSQIEDEKLDKLLDTADREKLDSNVYSAFTRDLQKAERLVYLTDNCGEIVLDKLLIQILRRQYPALQVTVIVRGKPVLNDATIVDAEFVGLPAIAKVLGNGTEIPGTQLDAISEEASDLIRGADIIVSKGQGNFETLHGCGLNIYYLFLCKCDWFVRRFQMERNQGVFINEKNYLLGQSTDS